ncbi:hypothetical protein GCM10009716_22070 [Streptomyces sodiiphilus]|uniref:Uncharacterized protein n=1 Tax=Streptomyces sodiiphilus TaxID=226217 RepID=A0ABN2P3R2_9ACTN
MRLTRGTRAAAAAVVTVVGLGMAGCPGDGDSMATEPDATHLDLGGPEGPEAGLGLTGVGRSLPGD